MTTVHSAGATTEKERERESLEVGSVPGEQSKKELAEVMEEGSSNSSSAPKGSELEALQKEHEEKSLKIQELKRQIEATKLLLENKKKKVPEEQIEAFNNLSKKYNTMRDEYQALLAKKSSKTQK